MGEQKQRKHKKLAKFVRPAWAALGFIPACLVPKTPLNIKLHTFWKPLLFSFDHLSKARICTVLYEPLIDFFFSQGKGAGVHAPLGPPSIQSVYFSKKEGSAQVSLQDCTLGGERQVSMCFIEAVYQDQAWIERLVGMAWRMRRDHWRHAQAKELWPEKRGLERGYEWEDMRWSFFYLQFRYGRHGYLLNTYFV